MKLLKFIFLNLIIILLITGCSTKGIEFTPNSNSVNKLKDINFKSVSIKKSNWSNNVEAIPVGRGTNKMLAPYGGSFQKYLDIALEEELIEASIYNHKSNIKIVTKLLKNKLDTGISIGTADVSSKFIIIFDDKEVFSNIYEIHHEWESSFVAGVAIPRTINNYPIAIQKLIDKFLFDDEVVILLRK